VITLLSARIFPRPPSWRLRCRPVPGLSFSLDAEDDGGTGRRWRGRRQQVRCQSGQWSPLPAISSPGATAAAIPIYEKAAIPMMSPSATNPKADHDRFQGLQRAMSSRMRPRANLRLPIFTTSWGVKDLAIMHDGQAYGQSLAP